MDVPAGGDEQPLEIFDLPDGEHQAAEVRPYTVTGGRTRSARGDLPLETLVEALVPPARGRTTEERDILALAANGYSSIVELSAHMKLPLGVVRVLVGDLEESGLLYVHSDPASPEAPSAATPLSVLESVLDGICAL
jgi:hypothetical protein